MLVHDDAAAVTAAGDAFYLHAFSGPNRESGEGYATWGTVVVRFEIALRDSEGARRAQDEEVAREKSWTSPSRPRPRSVAIKKCAP